MAGNGSSSWVGSGRPGPGRPPGPNKITLTRELFHKLGFDPELEAIKRYRDTSLSEDIRQSCLMALYDRYAPRLKAVDVNLNNNTALPAVQINIVSAPQSLNAGLPSLDHAVTLPQTVYETVNETVDETVESLFDPLDEDGEAA